jgi:hypothetical protein
LKIKLKGHHFDKIEVLEAESQAVLNTLTEHKSQNALEKMAEVLRTVHNCGRGLTFILHFLNQFWIASRLVCSLCEAMARSLSVAITAVLLQRLL